MKAVPLVKGKDVIISEPLNERDLSLSAIKAATTVTSISTTRDERRQYQCMAPVIGARDLPRGTLRDIIDQAGLTTDEFVDLL